MADLRRVIEVIVKDEQLDRHINKVRQSGDETERLGGRFTRLGGIIAGAFSVAVLTTFVAGLGRVSRKLFEVSTAAEETESKFRTVFGPASEQVDRFIADFGRLAGLTVTEGREITSTLGGMFKGMGETAQGAANMAEEVVRLAGDMASFNNADISDTLRAIQSGLIGEQEPLRRYGVLLSEARVQQFAASEAGGRLTGELTDQQRVMSRLGLIVQDLTAGGAFGDLIRTQESTQNSFRQTQRDMRQLVEDFSRGLIPAYGELIAAGRRLLDVFREQADSIGGGFARVVVRVTEYLVDFAVNTGRAAQAVGALLTSFNLLGTGGVGGLVSRFFELAALRVKELGIFINFTNVALNELFALVVEGSIHLNNLLGQDNLAADNRRIADGFKERAEAIRESLREQRRADIEAKRLREQRKKDLDEFLASLSAGSTDTGGPGGPGPGAETIEAAARALEKVQQAQRLAAAFSERERRALQDVVAAQEQIRVLKEIQKALGEDAVRDEMEAAQAQLRTAQAALRSAEAFRDRVREAAAEINKLAARGGGPIGLLRPPTTPSISSQFGVDDGRVSERMLRGVRGAGNEAARLARNLEDASRKGEDVAETMEGVALSIRAVTRLADVFGDLSDDARNFALGIADAVDALAKLDLTKLKAGGSDLASQIPVLISGAAGIASAVVGLGNILFADGERQRAESKRLREAMRDSARAFKEAVREAFTGGRVGEDVSPESINAVKSLFTLLRTAPTSILGNIGRDVIDQIMRFGLPGFEQFQASILQRFQQLVNEADPQDLGSGRVSPATLFAQAVREIVGKDSVFSQLLDDLAAQIGEFTPDVAGAVDQLRFFTQFMGEEGTAALQRFTQFLLSSVDGLTPALKALIQEASGLDVSTEAGRARLAEIVRTIAASFPDFLGGLTSGELESILQELKALAENVPVPGSPEASILGGRTSRSLQFADLLRLGANELAAAFRSDFLGLIGGRRASSLGGRLGNADLTTEEGREQWGAAIAMLAKAVLEGTTLRDFGLTEEQADAMIRAAESIGRIAEQQAPEVPEEERFTASLTNLRQLTQAQGSELVFIAIAQLGVLEDIRDALTGRTGFQMDPRLTQTLASVQSPPSPLPASVTGGSVVNSFGDVIINAPWTDRDAMIRQLSADFERELRRRLP